MDKINNYPYGLQLSQDKLMMVNILESADPAKTREDCCLISYNLVGNPISEGGQCFSHSDF